MVGVRKEEELVLYITIQYPKESFSVSANPGAMLEAGIFLFQDA